MKSLSKRFFVLSLIIFVVLVMVGCGGGGDSQDEIDATTGIDLKNPKGGVSGVVLIEGTQIPLEGATVKIDNKKTVTDSNGEFYISGISTGRKQLTVSKSEFDTYKTKVTINANKTTCINICLEPDYCGWDWQNPTTNGSNLYGASFPCEDTGYVVGAGGTILKTQSGGEKWRELDVPTENTLYAVFFPKNSETGWAVGENAILYTCNGGKDWVDQVPNIVSPPAGTDFIFYSVHFLNECEGWIVGSYNDGVDLKGIVLFTEDAGQTWNVANVNTTVAAPTELFSVYAVDEQNIYIAGTANGLGIVYQTIDGGATWVNRTPTDYSGPPIAGFRSLDFENLLKGYVVGDGSIFRTKNSGSEWEQVFESSPPCPEDEDGTFVISVAFNGKYGIASGVGGLLLYSDDYGNTWDEQSSPTDADLNFVTFGPNPKIAWAVGDYGVVLRSKNSGQTWKNLTSVTTADFEKVFFINKKRGWAVGEDGTILRTTNGGDTWKKQKSGTGGDLNDVFFINDERGWVVSESGKVLGTTNGGSDWKKLSSPFGSEGGELEAVWFLDSKNGFVVGEEGAIFRTKDGGKCWEEVYSGVDVELEDIVFVGKKYGWIAAEDGMVLRTNDGGQNWQTVIVNSEDLESISFVTSKNGWVVGENGAIYRTTDGGLTWEQQAVGQFTGYDLTDVYFTDCEHGYAVGSDDTSGILLYTDDAGQNWQSSPLPGRFFGIYFIDANTGWAVGEHGFIIKTITNGQECTNPL